MTTRDRDPHGVWRAGLAVAGMTLAACASIPNPTAEMATARSALDNARRAGAGQYAPGELNEAQAQMTAAERAQAGENYLLARRAAEQARAQAELAEEKVRLGKAEQSKAELDQTLRALRNEAAQPPRAQ